MWHVTTVVGAAGKNAKFARRSLFASRKIPCSNTIARTLSSSHDVYSLNNNPRTCTTTKVLTAQTQYQRFFSSSDRFDYTSSLFEGENNNDESSGLASSSSNAIVEDFNEEEFKAQRRKQYLEIDARRGRGFSDPWDIQHMLQNGDIQLYDEMLDWSPDYVSRVSQERVQILEQKIPTLSELSALALPPPVTAHPADGNAKLYALQRKRSHYKYLKTKVVGKAETQIASIQALEDWNDKQDAVDELFEQIEFDLREEEPILSKHPQFGEWIEKALEGYLYSLQRNSDGGNNNNEAKVAPFTNDNNNDNDTESKSVSIDSLSSTDGEATQTDLQSATDQTTSSEIRFATPADDLSSVPLFMDCFDPNVDAETEVVPKILIPLKLYERSDNNGRMTEEWDLAARKDSRRIMLRQSIRQIARALVGDKTNKNDKINRPASRVFVHGKKGIGKTAALAAIVASARQSGHIVLYLPDGNRLTKLGYYVEPNDRRPGIFDMPVWCQYVCADLLNSHKDLLEGFEIDRATIEKFFTAYDLEDLGDFEPNVISLLTIGSEQDDFSAMCISTVLDVLMRQDRVPFLVVMDEFNCYFQPGHFFHEEYDFDVKKPIPYYCINLYEPFLKAMNLADDGVKFDRKKYPMMKKGGIVVATTESHAISRKVTDNLIARAKAKGSQNMTCIEIPRLSQLEMEHMLANYETIGYGKLRLDQGETVMNPQEVAYLHTVSSGIPLHLFNACLMD